MYAFPVSFVLVYSTNTVRQFTFLIVKIEKLVVGAFLVSGVWHVEWWSLITSDRLIQVGNNRNDHFKYFFRCPRPLNRGVRLIKV